MISVLELVASEKLLPDDYVPMIDAGIIDGLMSVAVNADNSTIPEDAVT